MLRWGCHIQHVSQAVLPAAPSNTVRHASRLVRGRAAADGLKLTLPPGRPTLEDGLHPTVATFDCPGVSSFLLPTLLPSLPPTLLRVLSAATIPRAEYRLVERAQRLLGARQPLEAPATPTECRVRNAARARLGGAAML